MVDVVTLDREIQVGLERGWHVDDGEQEVGVRCVAVAVPVAVCWDVDGTLLRGGAVGGEVLRRAFAAITGLDAPEGVAMGGLTDRLVADAYRDLLPARQAAALYARGDEYGTAFAEAVAAEWAGREDELAAVTTVLPGVDETLAALAAEPGVAQVVVTGNVRAGAEAKLRAAGLAGPPLDLGAFGHIAGPRENLVHHARAALEEHHGGPVQLIVIGDTPRDVEAAHAAGALAVGVATGHGPESTVASLRAAGAEHVFADLSDHRRLVAVVRARGQDRDEPTRGSV